MKDLNGVLIRPVLTEKVLQAQETQAKYAFQVNSSANKIEIKNAIEHKFNVVVKGVCTINVKGKNKRMNTRRGLTRGRRSDWKKAIVTLGEGHSIDFFEGQQG